MAFLGRSGGGDGNGGLQRSVALLMLLFPQLAWAVTPFHTFHMRLVESAAATIAADAGPDNQQAETLSAHKRQLALQITHDVGLKEGSEGKKIRDFHLFIAAIVWEHDIKPEYRPFFTYSLEKNENPPEQGDVRSNIGATNTGSHGTLPLFFTRARLAPNPNAGYKIDSVLGFPNLPGAAVYVDATLDRGRGPRMACMVFYVSPKEAPVEGFNPFLSSHTSKSRTFRNAIDKCSKISVPKLTVVKNGLPFQIDLDTVARCVSDAYARVRHGNSRLRGIAVLVLYNPPHAELSQVLQHEDFGVYAPEGYLLMDRIDVQLPWGPSKILGAGMEIKKIALLIVGAAGLQP